MAEVILRKRAALYPGEVGLFSVDDEGRDLVGKIKDNRDVGADVIQRRNPRHHRLFFAILKFVREHSPIMENVPVKKLKTAIKLATGLVDTFVDVASGKSVCVPRSIAWAAMDQAEFNTFFNDACTVIAQRWMPEGTTAESVRDELILMVDGEHALPARRA